MSTAASPSLGPKPGKPFRVHHVAQYFQAGRKLTMLTAYDALTARIFDTAGLDMLLAAVLMEVSFSNRCGTALIL